jgi:hypothetical protein
VTLLAPRWILLVACLALPVACQDDEHPRDRNPPTDPAALFERICSRCHQRAELQGAEAADIRDAIDTIPSMKQLESRLSADAIRSLARLLADTGPPSENR